MPDAFRIESELSEKQIEADVASFFGYNSRHFGEFRLLDINEQLTGADKKFNWQGTAYFLQFKRPIGLKPLYARPRSNPKQPLQQIRVFRYTNQLDQEPYSVCFELRKPKKTERTLQHNVLKSLDRPPASRAIYVCPLSLTTAQYTQSLQHSPELFEFPFWDIRPQWIRHGDYVAHAAERAPFLRGHVSIVPHEDVASADHHYSFSAQGTDIAFHEPMLLEGGPSRLSDFVGREIRRAKSRPDSLTNIDQLARSLFSNAGDWAEGALQEPGSDASAWLAEHGRLLHSKYGIRQFVALAKF